MKKRSGIILCGLLFGLLFSTAANAKDMSVHTVIERIQGLEENILGRFALGGLIEADGSFASTDLKNTGDIGLSTAALGVDVDIVENVTCDLLFLYEEEGTESTDVGEGFITLDLSDVQPFFLRAGKMYLPFGNFESHFVSDPMTMEIGETNQGAASVTFASEFIEITGAVFNGDVDEIGNNDFIGSFALRAVYTIPENTIENFRCTVGASFITSIGDSDGLEDELPSTVSSHVAGFNVFASASFREKLFLEIEYLGAVDEFGAGELSFDGGAAFTPKAWNMEVAMSVTDALEIAAKYESGADLGSFLPEDRYGVAATWGVFENTRLSAEYLHGEFPTGGGVDSVTAQLAVEF